MTKKIINDILVSKKSIRQIPISLEKRHKLEKLDELEFESDHTKQISFDISKNRTASNWQRKPINPKFAIWLIAGLCLLSLFFGISIFFSSATIIVTPKTEKIVFNDDTYTAKSNSKTTTDLSFEILKVTQTTGEAVTAVKEKNVSQKATGVIIIYNNYSSSPQRLINNTRFEANNGKIYRINSSVIVPGLKKANGQITPGSIEATVFADQAGESYNLKLADLMGDFKIPGFKGDPRYQGFYARLKTDITGGFVGKQKIVSDDLRKTTEDSIKEKLKEILLKELYAAKPDNYIIFKDGYSIDYTNLADSVIDNDKVQINIEGDLNGIVFDNLKLSKYVAAKKISSYDNSPVELIPSDNLAVTFNVEDKTNLIKSDTLEIKFNGDATMKWLFDADAIKKDFAGKKESDLNNLTAKYANSISGIKVLFMPVWTRYFPDSINKIKVKEETP